MAYKHQAAPAELTLAPVELEAETSQQGRNDLVNLVSEPVREAF